MSQSIRVVALNYLARREHSIEELRNKLLLKSFAQEDVDLTLEELIEENLLNEFRFAECYCQSRIARGYGPIAIKHELNQKKVNKEIIDVVLERVNVNWGEVINKVFQKKFSPSAKFDAEKKAKCWRYFLQKGFEADQINTLLKMK